VNTTLSRKIIWFVSLSYAFAWLVWLPGILATAKIIPDIPWPPLFAIGACGPMIAAFWCLHREGGWLAVKNWLRAGFTRHFDWRWWLFIVLVPFIIPPLGLLLYRLVGGEVADLPISQQPWMVFPTILLMVTIGGGQEEFGWRGYLLPRLAERWQPRQVDIIMILVHAFWHLPLFFIAYTMQFHYSFWLFLVFGIGFTPLINQVFRQTGGSILAVVLFHGLTNAGLDIFPPVGSAVFNAYLPLVLIGLLFGLLALFIQRWGNAPVRKKRTHLPNIHS
jgi:membrane protease YdiL (CAAX protease family)